MLLQLLNEQYTDVSDKNGEVSDDFLSGKEEDKKFLYDSKQIESQLSDYFCLRNVERSIFIVEEGGFCQSDVDDFLDSDVETRNVYSGYQPDKDDLEINNFDNFQIRIQKF